MADEQQETPDELHRAPIPAHIILELETWRDHQLSVMPIRTNFLVNAEQLEQLFRRIIVKRFPDSQFERAVSFDRRGEPLDWTVFKPLRLVEKEEEGYVGRTQE